MNRLEIIAVRTYGDYLMQAGTYMRAFCREIRGTSLAGAYLYVNPSVPGDLAVILSWSSMSVTEQKSDIGLMLSDQLKQFGLVDHVFWIMVDEDEK